jgi:hypothetical protein
MKALRSVLKYHNRAIIVVEGHKPPTINKYNKPLNLIYPNVGMRVYSWHYAKAGHLAKHA